MIQYRDEYCNIPSLHLKSGYEVVGDKIEVTNPNRLRLAIAKSLLHVERKLTWRELQFLEKMSIDIGHEDLQGILQLDSGSYQKVMTGADNLTFAEEFLVRTYLSTKLLKVPVRADRLHRAIRGGKLPVAMYFEIRNHCWKQAIL